MIYSGDTISMHFNSVSAESRASFHSGHKLSSMIHLGGWFEGQRAFMSNVIKRGREYGD